MRIAALASLLLFTSFLAWADEVLILNAGASPDSNHQSQYLQTKTLYDDLRFRFPKLSTTVMFGAGNRTGEAPILADVNSMNGLAPGFIDNNQSANRGNFENFFKLPRLKAMGPQDTLFLFIGGHGMPFTNDDDEVDESFSNNCLDLWGFSANLETGEYFDAPPAIRCLPKNTLKARIEKQVGAGRTVFAMSQCFSGGFHQMAVNDQSKYPSLNNARICGFTAVPEDTTSSGCTPDVDGPTYQGYERSFTEQLTGKDLVTGAKLGKPRNSLLDVHMEATVDDKTKDIPLSTSDYYLWKWALAIQQKNFRPRTRQITAKQAQALLNETRIGNSQGRLPAYIKKDQFFARVQAALNLYPEFRPLLAGPLDKMVKAEDQMFDQLDKLSAARERELEKSESSARDQLYLRWNDFVRSGHSELTPEEAGIEVQMFSNPLPNDFLLLAMSIESLTKPEQTAATFTYRAKRDAYAAHWAEQSDDKKVKELFDKALAEQKESDLKEQKFLELERKHGHLRRLLIYRQVLAAWTALEKMRDTQALNDLSALLSCETATLN